MYQLYGLNAAGETGFAEVLSGVGRESLGDFARARLQDWHAVEIWDGPVCIVRVKRAADAPG